MTLYSRKVLLFLCVITFYTCCKCIKLSSLDASFKKAVDAYNDERWSECIVQFEESLHLFKLYKSININCRQKCNSETYEKVVDTPIEDLHIYEKFFRMQKCIDTCQSNEFDMVHMKGYVDMFTLNKMESKTPYEYLHVCYFQMNALPKAASAAFTYLAAHPDDETMRSNVEYYKELPEVDPKEMVDIESEEYKVLFELGSKAYNIKNWGETVAAMEEVLRDYISWENGCRVECEYHTIADSSKEFTITVSNNVAQLLQCKQNCQNKVKELGFNSGVEFLAEVLNYLHISYYHLDRLKDAASSVSSFLHLFPKDIDMLENKKIYMSLINKEAFVENDSIVYYFKRDHLEKKLIDFFLINNFQNYENANENSI